MNAVQLRLNRALRMSIIWEIIFASGDEGVTMGELAEVGGMSRSPYLVRVVRDLMSLGCIGERLERNDTGHAVTVFFALEKYTPA